MLDINFLEEYLKVSKSKLQNFSEEDLELAYIAIGKLIMRFNKIEPSEYSLSYSGGKDSHLLYWFVKKFLNNDDIIIVGVNTYREHPQIRDRILKNCDIVLYPELKMSEIKEKYGAPCFTKRQDDYISRWQGGCRTEYLQGIILGKEKSIYNINLVARKLLLDDTLHKVSNKCCEYTKERPIKKFNKNNKKKSIVGVRMSEGVNRKVFKSCLEVSGKFTPIFDFDNKTMDVLYRLYDIEIPSVYDIIPRTGCMGCPYGRNTVLELSTCTKSQIKYALDSFGDSYKVKDIYDDIFALL